MFFKSNNELCVFGANGEGNLGIGTSYFNVLVPTVLMQDSSIFSINGKQVKLPPKKKWNPQESKSPIVEDLLQDNFFLRAEIERIKEEKEKISKSMLSILSICKENEEQFPSSSVCFHSLIFLFISLVIIFQKKVEGLEIVSQKPFYMCKMCNSLLQDPQICFLCGLVCCKKFTLNSNNCSNCKEFRMEDNEKISQLILLKCKICDRQMTLKQSKEHPTTYKEHPRKCVESCSFEANREKLSQHQTNCPFFLSSAIDKLKEKLERIKQIAHLN